MQPGLDLLGVWVSIIMESISHRNLIDESRFGMIPELPMQIATQMTTPSAQRCNSLLFFYSMSEII